MALLNGDYQFVLPPCFRIQLLLRRVELSEVKQFVAVVLCCVQCPPTALQVPSRHWCYPKFFICFLLKLFWNGCFCGADLVKSLHICCRWFVRTGEQEVQTNQNQLQITNRSLQLNPEFSPQVSRQRDSLDYKAAESRKAHRQLDNNN